MPIAYFDTIAGISGDMTLGAFVSAGVSFDVLCEQLSKLGLPGFELQAAHQEQSGIVATHIDVVVSEQPTYHRHLSDINEIIDKSGLSPAVKERATSIFLEVAKAEAAVHHATLETIHFHEVGAIDSLVDIVGASICLEQMGITEVYSSPVKVGGGGFVNAAHGALPVPTPATVEILKGYPTILTDIQTELTTPTGAAIIKALSRGTIPTAELTVHTVGYGAGTKQIPGIPNLLRLMIGERSPGYAHDSIVQIETTIDDMNPEIIPFVMERLFAAGALDAFVTQVLMKKGRPGMVLTILGSRNDLDRLLAIVFRETTTLGVRIQPVERAKLARSHREVSTAFGVVRVKAVEFEGSVTLVPEFEECRRIAEERGLPLKEVYRQLEKELGGS